MDSIINFGIPHVGEHIFESIDTPGLINCLEVSETWKVLAENVLTKRWKGKMYEACKSGETKIVQLLLERCNSEENRPNIKDKFGGTAFIWACLNEHKEVVKLLLDHVNSNIEVNARDSFGGTAFTRACKKGHKDIVQLFLNHSEPNIDLNAKDNSGWNASMHASGNGQKDVVKLLLNHSERIELNARSNN